MEIYYNFWQNLPALVQSATNNKRNLIPLTDEQSASIDQNSNNGYFYLQILPKLVNPRWDFWQTELQPLLVDYITRCRASAPEGATGQYLVDCYASWVDNTKQWLQRAHDHFLHNAHNFSAAQAVTNLIDQCDTEKLKYECDLIISRAITAPLVQSTNNRPAPEQTAQYAPPGYRAKALELLQFEGLQQSFDKLFEIEAFGNNNGVWVWNTNKYTLWELALFIMLVDNVVNYGLRLTLNDDITKPQNWRYFEGWIEYKGKPLTADQIKQTRNRVFDKASDEINNNPIFTALLAGFTE